jgi:FixJ family two-component response regulator
MTGVVAVVDDDPRVLESLENLLESAGYRVRLFPSPGALLVACDLAHTDCLISDIRMPIMDGLALAQVVNQLFPELPVILITARDLPSEAIANRPGIHGCFHKPFDAQQLLAAVASAIMKRLPP